jgi:hypothetical protein
MNPCGVQLARPILPPDLQTPRELGCRLVLVRREHHAEGREHDVVAVVRKRQRFGIRLAEFDRQMVRRRALLSALEQRRHIVRGCDVTPAACGRQCRIAVAGGDVQHLAAGAYVECLTELLPDDLQGGADDGIVAGRPGAMLALLDGGKIRCGWLECGGCRHEQSPAG